MRAKEDKAIIALLEQPSLERAAEQAGISVSQLRRWLHRGDFRKRLEAARDEIFEQAIASLARGLSVATQTLVRCCGEDQPPSVQVASARCLLEISGRAYERTREREIEARLDKLEAAVRNRHESQPIALAG